MIARLSKPLHAGSEASKCTPTISILTPPLSSGLLPPAHYHQEWCTSSFPITREPKCHAGNEMKYAEQMAPGKMCVLVWSSAPSQPPKG